MKSKKKVTGFLGGTFDPIHIGHLHLAFEAKERFSLDEVLFCPTFISPLKLQENPVVTSHHRLKMVSLAIEGIPGFSLLDYEMNQEKVTYTVDTIRFLKTLKPESEYALILGEDHLNDFFKWKEVEELLKLVSLKIASREGVAQQSKHLPLSDQQRLQEGFFKIPNLEISSTYLRARLALKKYCKHLIPPKVVDYIEQHRLYLTS
jgi:nicotinate-nucleotide adenylyltransferase